MGADKDDTHDGGVHKGKSVLITVGPHKKKKGLVVGGGHGLFLVELTGREKGNILKARDQFKRVDGVAINTSTTAEASAAAATASLSSSSRSSKTESSSQSSRTSSRNRNGNKDEASRAAAASSRPRRSNAGVNKTRTTTASQYSSRARKPNDPSSGEDGEEEKPTTPAAKAAYKNKEKVKSKLRVISNGTLECVWYWIFLFWGGCFFCCWWCWCLFKTVEQLNPDKFLLCVANESLTFFIPAYRTVHPPIWFVS